MIEEAGVATVAIGLIRPQIENTKPPRALWVPFELGRPFGPPSDPAFQCQVIRAALTMLVENGGPVRIVDYPHDDPRLPPDPGWRAPIAAAPAGLVGAASSRAFETEIERLAPAYEQSVARRGRTTVGLLGRPIAEAAHYVARWLAGEAPPSPVPDMSPPLALRFAIDDVKAYALEAGLAEPAHPSSRQLGDWLWNETAIGQAFFTLRRASLNATDERLKMIASNFIVPGVRALAAG
jgi:hypothetical protein